MDKKFVMGIAAMAALALVSCSSDDLDSFSGDSSKNEAISFDSYLGRSAVAVNGSRGSVLTKDSLQNFTKEGFGVFGNYSSTEFAEGTQATYGENWFDNVQVTYKDSKWTYSPLKFWPTEGYFDFLAYAPYINGTKLTGSSIDFTVADNVANQKDLLYAKAVGQTKDKISATTEKKVKFQFAHALSRLGYTVKLYKDNPSNATFTLNKLTLAGSYPKSTKETAQAFYTKGTINLATGNWTPIDKDKKQDFEWVSSDKTVSNTGIKNDKTDYLFVIPQNFSEKIGEAQNPDKLYVIVKYTIDYGGGVKQENMVYKQLTTNFVQGKAYMLNLTIGLPIEFDVDVVEGWEKEDNIYIGSETNPWDRE